MGLIRFDNDSSVSSPAASLSATSTDDGYLPSLSSSTEIGLLTPSDAKPYPTHSLTHHHTILYTHSFAYPFTQSFPDSPSSVLPTGLSSPQNPPPRAHDHNHKSLIALIFAVIGGSIVLFFLALFTRQAIAYSRLPRRNKQLTAAAREELIQELAGCADRRRQSCLAPPPYERAPPYESCSPHQPV
ncbi:hypothetical protein DFH94DRAFT_240181 [Russula ochroleuca]|uniref:Uncharacterized protein n=1 Tax=Russula ochroleuca TaxID=152965 RepID=A0A9P5TCM9_9AGAM|nr:hypothetical protein DFH94DRAFT_240181 [Russula ochroleuca]